MASGSFAQSSGAGHPANEGFDNVKRPLEQARHLPGYLYSDSKLLDLEKQKIFMKDWLCVAREEELEKTGDFMTFDVVGEPLLLVRDEKGELNALVNMCSHRGVEVADGSGNVKEFSCPYHGWLYDLEGKLIGAPYMKESEVFDAANCRLRPVRLEAWAGWVFINFDPDAPSLSESLADIMGHFNLLRAEDCRLAFKVAVELDCNWKFFVENLIDVYHSRVVHAKTLGRKRGDPDKYPFHLLKNGGTAMFYDSGPMTPTAETLFRKMPWIEDRPETFACSGRVPPNMQLFGRSDNVHSFVMWPLDVDHTQVIHYTLFPKEFFDDPEFDDKIKIYRDFVLAVAEEDEAMVRSLQRAMHSNQFEPGPMSVLERGIHHVINSHLERIFGDS